MIHLMYVQHLIYVERQQLRLAQYYGKWLADELELLQQDQQGNGTPSAAAYGGMPPPAARRGNASGTYDRLAGATLYTWLSKAARLASWQFCNTCVQSLAHILHWKVDSSHAATLRHS